MNEKSAVTDAGNAPRYRSIKRIKGLAPLSEQPAEVQADKVPRETEPPQAKAQPRKSDAATHSPLPWDTRPVSVGYGGYGWEITRHERSSNQPSQPYEWDRRLAFIDCDDKEARSNAAFIVEACNNYERVKTERDNRHDILTRAAAVLAERCDADAVASDDAFLHVLNKLANERDYWKNEYDHMSKCYQGATNDLRADIEKAEARADELLAALKPFLAVVGRIGIKSQHEEILIASGRLTAQEAMQFSDGFVKLSKLAAIAKADASRGEALREGRVS